MSSDPNDFLSNFERLQREFEQQYGRPFRVTGVDTSEHVKLHGAGNARDVGAHDLDRNQTKWIVDRAKQYGFDVRDFSWVKSPTKYGSVTLTGPHIHMQRASGQIDDGGQESGSSYQRVIRSQSQPAMSPPGSIAEKSDAADGQVSAAPRGSYSKLLSELGLNKDAAPVQAPANALAPADGSEHPIYVSARDEVMRGAKVSAEKADEFLASKHGKKQYPGLRNIARANPVVAQPGGVPSRGGQVQQGQRVSALQSRIDELNGEINSLSENRNRLTSAGYNQDPNSLATIDSAINQRARERALLQDEVSKVKQGTAPQIPQLRNQLSEIEQRRASNLHAAAQTRDEAEQRRLYSMAHQENQRAQALKHYIETEEKGDIAHPALREMSNLPVVAEHQPSTWEKISGGVGSGAAGVFAGMNHLGANLFNSDALRRRASEYEKLGAISSEEAGPGLTPAIASTLAQAGLAYGPFRAASAIGQAVGPGIGIGELGGEAGALGLYGAAEHAHEGPMKAAEAGVVNMATVPAMRAAGGAALPTRAASGFASGFLPTYFLTGDIEQAYSQGLLMAGMGAAGKNGRQGEAATSRRVDEFPVGSIQADPERFQYKQDHAKSGASGTFDREAKFNAEMVRDNPLQVWSDTGDGKTYIIDGHNRLALAKRDAVETVPVEFIKAKTAEEAKAVGAIKNIIQGNGTEKDTARFVDESGLTPEQAVRLARDNNLIMPEPVAQRSDALPRSGESENVQETGAVESQPSRRYSFPRDDAKYVGKDAATIDLLYSPWEEPPRLSGHQLEQLKAYRAEVAAKPDEFTDMTLRQLDSILEANRAHGQVSLVTDETATGMTPGRSGTTSLSNEELARTDRFYRVDKSGTVTSLGKQPDTPLRPGDAVVAVDSEDVGRIYNSSGVVDHARAIAKAQETLRQQSTLSISEQVMEKAPPALVQQVESTPLRAIADKSGLSPREAAKGVNDVIADGSREFSPEAVAVKRGVLRDEQPASGSGYRKVIEEHEIGKKLADLPVSKEAVAPDASLQKASTDQPRSRTKYQGVLDEHINGGRASTIAKKGDIVEASQSETAGAGRRVPSRESAPVEMSKAARAALEAHKLPADEITRAASTEPVANEPKFVTEARERLRKALKGNTLSANPVKAFVDSAIITGYDIAKTAKDFGSWSSAMTKRLGEKVRPHLKEIWEELKGFGPQHVINRLKSARLIPDSVVADALSGDRPEYLTHVANFIQEQRQKVMTGKLGVPDVAKAYYMTVASQGATAIKAETLLSKLEAAGIKIDLPEEYLSTNKKGERMIRPEEAAGAWLLGGNGKRAISELEAGKFNEKLWAEAARVREAFGDDRVNKNNMLGATRQGAFNMRNVAELADRMNRVKGQPQLLGALASKLNGVGVGKQGFIKHLLGFGDSPTIDSVELNFWLTGKGNISQLQTRQAELARAIKDFTGNSRVSREISDRINRRFNDLRQSGRVAPDLPDEAFNHIIHQWLWDKAKGETNSHVAMYDAMREPEMVQKSRARLRESLSGKRLNSNPLHDIYDQAIVTGWELYKGAKNFGEWSAKMISEFHEDVKPHLEKIWGEFEGSKKEAAGPGARPAPSAASIVKAMSVDSGGRVRAADEGNVKLMREAWDDQTPSYGSKDENGKTRLVPLLDSYMRANQLAGASPFTHKLGSLASTTVSDGLARPGAVLADAVRSKVDGGGRTMLIDPVGLGRAASAAVIKGIPEAWEIFRKGYTPEQVSRYGLPTEVTGRNPLLQGLINYTFRTYRAGAHVFETYAYERAMSNQAKIWAIKEAGAGITPKNGINARAEEIMRGENVSTNVQAVMENNAILASVDAVFQADNPITRKWTGLKSLGGDGWQFGLNRLQPFMRAPSNALLKTLDYLPTGAATRTAQALYSKARWGEAFRTDADAAKFAQSWGRLPVGIGLFMLGGAMHRAGLMTPLGVSEAERETEGMVGKSPGSLLIGKTWLDIARFSPPGLIMALGATYDNMSGHHPKKEQGTPETVMGDLAQTLGEIADKLPLAQGFETGSKLLKKDDRLGELKDIGLNQATALVPGYSTVRDVFKGHESAILEKLPFVDKALGPQKRDPLGHVPEDKGYLGQVLHYQTAKENPVAEEMLSRKAFTQTPAQGPKESDEDYVKRITGSGEMVEQKVSDLLKSAAYQGLDDYLKHVVLKLAVKEARGDYKKQAEGGRLPDPEARAFNVEVLAARALANNDLKSNRSYKGLSKHDQKSVRQSVAQMFSRARAKFKDDVEDARDDLRDLVLDLGDSVQEMIDNLKEKKEDDDER
jgi:hypothetical protein